MGFDIKEINYEPHVSIDMIQVEEHRAPPAQPACPPVSYIVRTSTQALVAADRKAEILTATSDGIYKVARLAKFLALGAEYANFGMTVAGRVLDTSSSWMDVSDSLGILSDLHAIVSGTVKQKFLERDYYSLSKMLVAFVGINVPSTILFLDKVRLVDLGIISSMMGSASKIALVPFLRSSVIVVNLMTSYEALQKLRSGEEAKTREGAILLTSAVADIALQTFYLAGCTSMPGLVILGTIAATAGIAKLLYQTSQTPTAWQQAVLTRSEGMSNVARLVTQCVEDLVFASKIADWNIGEFGELSQELKSVTSLVTMTSILGRWVNFDKEYTKADIYGKTKYVLLTVGNAFDCLRGLENHGIAVWGALSQQIGQVPILGVVGKLNLKIAGGCFIIAASTVSIGITTRKMWTQTNERNMRNTLSLAKEFGKIGLITFSGSLGVMGGFCATPYFLTFATAANAVSLAKTAYEVKFA